MKTLEQFEQFELAVQQEQQVTGGTYCWWLYFACYADYIWALISGCIDYSGGEGGGGGGEGGGEGGGG